MSNDMRPLKSEQSTTLTKISSLLEKLTQQANIVERKMDLIRDRLFGSEPVAEESKAERQAPVGLLAQWEMQIASAVEDLSKTHSDIIHLMRELEIKEMK